jgi:mannose PTS system EIIA component
MNGVLILAHAPLASALKQCALHVFPDAATAIAALDVQANESPGVTLQQARMLAEQLGTRHLLVLADLFGATPCNVATQLVQQWIQTEGGAARLVAGVNAPMLLRAVTYRHEALDQLVSRAVAGGTQGVLAISPAAPQNQARKQHDPNHHDHQQ